MQRNFTYRQVNAGTPEEVFPLLCPVREADWLDGWAYRMVHSVSGVAEKDCVFATPHHGEQETIWQITEHDPVEKRVEFVRLTPGENAVRIGIRLEAKGENETYADISYLYTGLTAAQDAFIQNELPAQFQASMEWWERSINHYLKTGEKLLRSGE